jgi:hypothetical protein
MAGIADEAAAKRPFDEHRLAVLMLRIFSCGGASPQRMTAAAAPWPQRKDAFDQWLFSCVRQLFAN